MLRERRLPALLPRPWAWPLLFALVTPACTSSATYRVNPGPVPPGALPVNSKGLGFVVEQGRRLIRAVAWIEPLTAQDKNRGALDNRLRASAAVLVERFRNELESRWARAPHDAALPRCNDGSTQCWLWVDACTLKSATVVDRFEEGPMHVAVGEIDLTSFVICVERQHSLAAPEAEFVLSAYAAAHTALATPEVAAALTTDLADRWQRYQEALARRETPAFDPGNAVPTGTSAPAVAVPTPASAPPTTLPAADARATPRATAEETPPPAASP